MIISQDQFEQLNCVTVPPAPPAPPAPTFKQWPMICSAHNVLVGKYFMQLLAGGFSP